MKSNIKNIREFGREKFSVFFIFISLFAFSLPMLKIITLPFFSNMTLCDFQFSVLFNFGNEEILFFYLFVIIFVLNYIFPKIRACYIKNKIKKYFSENLKNCDFIFKPKKEKTLSDKYDYFCLSKDIGNLNKGVFNYYTNLYSICFVLLSMTIFYFLFDPSILVIGLIIAILLLLFAYLLIWIFNMFFKRTADNTYSVMSFNSFAEFEKSNWFYKKLIYIFWPSTKRANFTAVINFLTNKIYNFAFNSQLVLPIILSIVSSSEILRIYLIFEVVIFFFYSIFSLLNSIFSETISLQHNNFIERWGVEK